jgi:short-subunit dehydrogenase
MSYALVTGASKGIGKEIVKELAMRGYDLLLIARNSYELQMVKEEMEKKYAIQADYLVSDLSEPGSVDRIMECVESKQIDLRILVNNAGYGLVGPFESYSYEENQKMMQVNTQALVEMCQKCYPYLSGKGQAYVLNIASSTAYQAIPNMSLDLCQWIFIAIFPLNGLFSSHCGASLEAEVIRNVYKDDFTIFGVNARFHYESYERVAV